MMPKQSFDITYSRPPLRYYQSTRVPSTGRPRNESPRRPSTFIMNSQCVEGQADPGTLFNHKLEFYFSDVIANLHLGDYQRNNFPGA
jgi:hypothetical protein